MRSEASLSASPHLQIHRGADHSSSHDFMDQREEQLKPVGLLICRFLRSFLIFLLIVHFFIGPTGVDAAALYGFHIQ